MSDPLIDQILFSRDEWDELVAQTTRPLLQDYIRKGGEFGAGQAEALGVAGSFDVLNPEVERWISTYTFKFAKKVNDLASDRLRDILTEGLNAGESIPKLSARILEDPILGDVGTKYRAELIARTETARAETSGQEQAWKMANEQSLRDGAPAPFAGKVWRTNADACDFCIEMDGKEIDLGAEFFAQGSALELEGVGAMSFNYEGVEGPPLHPNCRCSETPIISEAYAV